MIKFYVSTQGKDTWSGRLSDPAADGSDGPFATLERAREAVRQAKGGGLPPGGIEVLLRGGQYLLEQSFQLLAADSGEEGAPVCYRSYPGEEARLQGGRQLPRFEPVRDPEVLERLDAAVRDKVLQADLAALGIRDFGGLRTRPADPEVPAHMELFFNGRVMTLARYPNPEDPAFKDGWAVISGVGRFDEKDDGHGTRFGVLEEGFHYTGDRPLGWKSFENIWVHGYWMYDWANTYEQVDSIDPTARLVKTKPPYGRYGFRIGERFYFLNVLEELDSPGEYYIDTSRGMLYFYPPETLEGREALVSILEEPLVCLGEASHIRLESLTLECCRSNLVLIEGGRGNLVAGCTLRYAGGYGILIRGGLENGVQSCDLTELGEGGILLEGGDRPSLQPCEHFSRNNHIWRFAHWSRCYRPGVELRGVGMTIANNHIHHAPHVGILYWGNENLIEYCDLHDLCLETGDSGAIYSGRDYTARGNLIRFNYLHDLQGVGEWGCMGMYFDDCLSGQTFSGNILRNCHRAVYVPGGREIVLENNIFIDCTPAVEVMAHSLMPDEIWRNMINVTMKQRVEEMKVHQPPYAQHYPELLELDAFYARGEGVPPKVTIQRNICLGTWALIHRYAKKEHITFADNLVNENPRFTAANFHTCGLEGLRLLAGSPAQEKGFEPIPLEKIGLVIDAYRKVK